MSEEEKQLQENFKELIDWGVAFGWNCFGQLGEDSQYWVSVDDGFLPIVTTQIGQGKKAIVNIYTINDIIFDPDSKFIESLFGEKKVKVDIVPHHLTANFYLPNATYRRFICIQQKDYGSIINYLLKALEAHGQANQIKG